MKTNNKKKGNTAKKLIPAAMMLAVSASMLGTSTYAWFSMSKTVTITGMEVTAKTDAIFLEVNGTEDNGAYGLTGTNAVDAELYPAHHEAWTALSDIEDFDLNDDNTNDNWYYRYNDNADNATDAMTAKTYIGAFTDYVATTAFNVRLHAGSQATGYDLYVSEITIPANKGITVVVAGVDGYQEFSASAQNITFNASNILSNDVTIAAEQVKVYIYFNGDDANVYTDNIAALTGEVEVKLSAFTTDQNPT